MSTKTILKAMLFISGWVFVFSALANETLVAGIDAAEVSDPKWKAAIQTRAAAIEKLPQARAGLLPQLALRGTLDSTDSKYVTTNSIANIEDQIRVIHANELQVKLTQPIFRWSNIVAYWQADYDVLAADKMLEKEHQDLMLRVAEAYLVIASAEEVFDAANSQLDALSDQYKLVKKSYDIGVANVTELRESEAKFEIGKGDQIAAKRDLHKAKAAYAAIVGRKIASVNIFAADTTLSAPKPNSESAWVDSALEYSPAIHNKRALYEKSALDVQRQRSDHYPTLDLTGTLVRRETDHTETSLEGYLKSGSSIGLEVNLPIFSGFSTVSKVRESEAYKIRAFEDLEYARRTLTKDISDAFSVVNDGVIEIEVYRKALSSSRKSVDANFLGYKVGVKSNIDVLNAQQQVFNATRRLVKTKYDVLFNLLKLKSLVGNLSKVDFYDLDRLLLMPKN